MYRQYLGIEERRKGGKEVATDLLIAGKEGGQCGGVNRCIERAAVEASSMSPTRDPKKQGKGLKRKGEGTGKRYAMRRTAKN